MNGGKLIFKGFKHESAVSEELIVQPVVHCKTWQCSSDSSNLIFTSFIFLHIGLTFVVQFKNPFNFLFGKVLFVP